MKYIKMILKRPMSAILIILAIVVFGISAMKNIQLEYFPDLEMPMEVVSVVYPGADADSIERLVTEKIEDAGENLTGIESIESSSYENYAVIQFTYEYGTDLDEAYMELKEQLDNLKEDLPEECETPTIMEISLDSAATISVAAESADGTDILDYVNDTVIPKLESINGVAQVEVAGNREKYLKVVVNEEKMKQYGLSLSTVGSYIAGADFDLPVGTIVNGSQEIGATAYTDVNWNEDLKNVAIETATGALIHLSDVADVINLYQKDPDSISRFNGKDSVLIDVTKKSSSPTITVCNTVEDVLKTIKNDSIEFEVIHSSADDIMDTLLEVLKTLLEGVIFTMIILFLFFGDIRASLIVGSSMPLSLFTSMILLNAMGVSFDLMTGTGMIIAIGMIVDNSIVVLENCFRMKEQETDFKAAAAKGAATMFLSVSASTLTTIVVYAPMTTTTGMSGQMNKPLCYAVIFTMLASLISAITVVPLFFTLIKPKEKKSLPINKVLNKLGNGYKKIIPVLLHHPKTTILAAVLLFVSSIGLATQLHMDLFPSNFDGSVQVEATFRSGTKLEVMNEEIQSIEQALIDDKNFDSIELEITDNTAKITANSAKTCKRSSEEAVEYYTNLYSQITNIDIAVSPYGVSTGLASLMSTGNNVKVTLLGDDLRELSSGASLVEEALTKVPGVIKVKNDLSGQETNARFVIDQQKAMNAGMTPAAVAGQLYYLMNGVTATTLEHEDEEYDVVLEYPENKYDNITTLMDQALTTTSGKHVALSDIATVEYTNIMQTINRQDKKYVAEITATTTTADKYTASGLINAAAKDISLPDGVSIGQSTTDAQLSKEVGSMGNAIIAAIFLVFLVMAIQFESPRLSFMVMLCIPFSLIGSFGLLYFSQAPLSMMAMMGFLMLIGMVVNNGILLVDATGELRKEMPLDQALMQAGLTRLRPILMTTLTTVISMLPMVLSSNSGMNMMRGMGFVIIGGLCTSTLLAMFLMPPFYLVISGENLEGDGKKKRKGLLKGLLESRCQKKKLRRVSKDRKVKNKKLAKSKINRMIDKKIQIVKVDTDKKEDL